MAGRLAFTPIRPKGESKKRIAPEADGQRKPRERDSKHMACIAMMDCVVCGKPGVHVAHIRYASAIDDAPLIGKQEKPSDWRTLPLCPSHHTDGPDAQHKMMEAAFWQMHGINPYALAKALYGCSGDLALMEQLVSKARLMFPARRT